MEFRIVHLGIPDVLGQGARVWVAPLRNCGRPVLSLRTRTEESEYLKHEGCLEAPWDVVTTYNWDCYPYL